MDAKKLTLDQPATYRIEVPGMLDDNWSDWFEEIIFEDSQEAGSTHTSILTGSFDQAGLIGILRRLYSQGIPLISVKYVDSANND